MDRIHLLLPKAICDAECEVQIACEGDVTDSSEGIEDNKNGVGRMLWVQDHLLDNQFVNILRRGP